MRIRFEPGEATLTLSEIFEGSCVSGHGGWPVGQPAEDEGPACQPAADTDHRLGDVHPVFAGVFTFMQHLGKIHINTR